MSTTTARDVFIVDCVRSPIGQGRNDQGVLHNIHPVALLATVLDNLAARNGLNKGEVEDVICGCVTPLKQQGANIPRLAALQAGYPITVTGVQLNRMCGSGQQAIHFAAQSIASGDQELVIAAGIEMMSVVPMGADAEKEIFTTGKVTWGTFPYKLVHQGFSAELIAEKWKLSRKELDEFAVQSHKKGSDASKAGYFKSQIVPIRVTKKNQDGTSAEQWVTTDEGIRWPVDVAKIGTLPTIFKKNGGVVTAANASQISDGAGAVLLASGAKADQLGLKKRARIVARVVVGVDPEMMLHGVIPATQKALQKANLKLEDIDVFEVNEAFASVVCAWQKELGVPAAKINPNGGAIAHGHPLGASGCVLMTKLVNELERSKKRYGLQTMCIGHGQATATIIENCSFQGSKL